MFHKIHKKDPDRRLITRRGEYIEYTELTHFVCFFLVLKMSVAASVVA